MTRPTKADRSYIIAHHTDAALARLAELRVALHNLNDLMHTDVEVPVYNLGTGHPDVYRAVVSIRTACEHVQSAWRALNYATANLNDR